MRRRKLWEHRTVAVGKIDTTTTTHTETETQRDRDRESERCGGREVTKVVKLSGNTDLSIRLQQSWLCEVSVGRCYSDGQGQ